MWKNKFKIVQFGGFQKKIHIRKSFGGWGAWSPWLLWLRHCIHIHTYTAGRNVFVLLVIVSFFPQNPGSAPFLYPLSHLIGQSLFKNMVLVVSLYTNQLLFLVPNHIHWWWSVRWSVTWFPPIVHLSNQISLPLMIATLPITSSVHFCLWRVFLTLSCHHRNFLCLTWFYSVKTLFL